MKGAELEELHLYFPELGISTIENWGRVISFIVLSRCSNSQIFQALFMVNAPSPSKNKELSISWSSIHNLRKKMYFVPQNPSGLYLGRHFL
ncbi:hypothetical protein MANES_14G074850v8 [Manihot esculenta]|uniref:Uncharacterized protein n=1 Tax=Manihot esculenta TaxID=3983 RepID=A0ACB7GG73_MANES|nr:hypothetical protein MANES_14G074850v8 [Manihot esculenta]